MKNIYNNLIHPLRNPMQKLSQQQNTMSIQSQNTFKTLIHPGMKKTCSIVFLTWILLFTTQEMSAQCTYFGAGPCSPTQPIVGVSNPNLACLIPDLCLFNGFTGSLPSGGVEIAAPAWCTTVENNIYYAFEGPPSESVTFHITDIACTGGNNGLQAAILDCNLNFTSYCWTYDGVPAFTIESYDPLIPGDLYYLMLDGTAGAVCDYTIIVDPKSCSNNPSPAPPVVDGSTNVCLEDIAIYDASSQFIPAPGSPEINDECTYIEWSISPPIGTITTNPNDNSIEIDWQQTGSTGLTATVINTYWGNIGASTLIVNVVETIESYQEVDLCTGECYQFGSDLICDPGMYEMQFDIAGLCDSTVFLTVNMLQAPETLLDITLPCEGFYEFQGDTLTDLFFEYDFVFPAQNGCDSTVSIILEPNNTVFGEAGASKVVDCPQLNSVSLEGSVNYPSTGFSILWTTDDGIILSGETTLSPLVASAGTYCMTITELATGCLMTDCSTVIDTSILSTLFIETNLGSCNPNIEDSLCAFVPGNFNLIYSWSTIDGEITSDDDLPCIEINGNGIYDVTVVDPLTGCQATQSVEVNSPSLIAEAGPSPALDCISDMVQLNGSGSTVGPEITYEWTTTSGQIISGVNTLQPIVLATGSYYYLTVTNTETGCLGMDSVFVDFVPFFLVEIEPVSFDCFVDEITLTAQITHNSNLNVYNWETNDGNIIGGADGLQVIIDAPGTYCITAESSFFGCISTDCQTIQGPGSNLVAEAGPDGTIDCSGAPYTLNGTGSSMGPEFSYEWAAQNCCILSGANTLIPIVNTQGWYYLTVTDNDSGCMATDSVYVHGLEVEIDPASLLCDITEITLHAEVTGGSVASYGFWTTVDGNIVSGADTNNPVINAPGTYCYQTISLGQYCMIEECINVELDQSSCGLVEGYVLVDGNSNCQTDAGEMPLSGWLVTATGSNGTFYGTTDSNGFYSIPVEPGVYTVTLTAASNTYEVCTNDVVVGGLPSIPPIPSVDFTDNCGGVSVEFSEEIINIPAANNHQLIRTWVATDEVGNSSTTTQTITLTDNEPPIASNIPSDMTVDCGGDVPQLVNPVFTDDCGEVVVDFSEVILTDSATDEQVLRRTWVASDEASNFTTVTQNITFNDNVAPFATNIPPDLTVACSSDIPANDPPIFSDNCNLFTVDFSEVVTIDSSTDENVHFNTWVATDEAGNSTTVTQVIVLDDNQAPVLIGAAPIDVTVDCGSEIPPAPTVEFADNCELASVVLIDTLFYDSAVHKNTFCRLWTAKDGAGNQTVVKQTVIIADTIFPVPMPLLPVPPDITVSCFSDVPSAPMVGLVDNCNGFIVDFSKIEFSESFIDVQVLCRSWSLTDDAGNQTVLKQLITINDNQPPQVVNPSVDAVVSCNTGSNAVVDFSVNPETPCPVLTVDLSNNILRRCSEGNYFFVNYCNEGTETALDAYVEVTLDPDLTFVYSSIGSLTTHVGGQVYSFAVGDLDPDECGQFWFQAFLDCDAEIAETHCTEAHIFPDSPCFPSNPLWSGASLEVRASCSDSTRFTITNVGTAALTVPAGYLVIEDAVMYRPGEVGLLTPGESMVVALPANGSTWRLELEQEPFHSFPNVPVAWIEGCGDNAAGTISTNYVNQRFLGDPELHTDTDCTMNQAAFDPNDKQGFPLGHSAERFIQKENQIEYLIRFQNTGNDTAFQVVIQDTLDDKLDLTTLRPGAASHLYDYEIYGTGILKFTFPNILLPDSTTDLVGSQGFVQFIVSPKQTIQPGDVIENEAAIYFDNNDPIITNTTFHTIEKPKVYELETVQICFGETFNGLEITADTMLTEVFPFAEYDSISFTNLQVLPIFDAAVNATICEGESYFFANENLTQTGTYTAVFTSLNGCDSTVVLTLDILNNVETELTEEICAGSIYPFNGQLLTSTGIYEETLQSTNGCDSLVRLDLQVLEVFETTIGAEICEGSLYEFNGDSLTGSGVYEAMLIAENGCDSLVILNLEVSNNLEENITANICAGESYEFGGEVLTGSGFYEITVPASGGCDSTTVLSLMVWDQYEMARKATICHGDSAEFNGAFFYDSGYYTAELTTINGCDSILILDLTVLDSIGSSFSQTICENEPFIFNGETLTETGTYEAVFPSAEGCDSTVVLFLEVEPVFSDTIELAVEPGEIINGLPIYSDTSFIVYLVAQNGCDSTVVTNIDVILNAKENIASTINLSIFPNPTDERFYVKFNLPNLQNVQVEILDVIGQKVVFASQKSTYPLGEHFIEINAESWPSGVYLVHFQMDSGVATGRVVVE